MARGIWKLVQWGGPWLPVRVRAPLPPPLGEPLSESTSTDFSVHSWTASTFTPVYTSYVIYSYWYFSLCAAEDQLRSSYHPIDGCLSVIEKLLKSIKTLNNESCHESKIYPHFLRLNINVFVSSNKLVKQFNTIKSLRTWGNGFPFLSSDRARTAVSPRFCDANKLQTPVSYLTTHLAETGINLLR